MKKTALFLIIASLLFSSVGAKHGIVIRETSASEPDYSNLSNWAASPFKDDTSDSIPDFLKEEIRDKRADVFFIHPTSYFSDADTAAWNADLSDTEVNQETDFRSILFQATVFNGSCRVFAPRYRQANMKAFYALGTPIAKEAFDLAYSDVRKAFLYFLENYNETRPIIIASHSQGSLHALRLLQEFFDGTPLQKRLVCAYVVGYQIEKNAFKRIPVGESADQTGCFVGWRSYLKGEIPKGVEAENGNSVCVNPLTWTTSGQWASPEFHQGVMNGFETIIPHTAGAGIEPATKILWVDAQGTIGENAEKAKNLHIYDYNLFWMNIRQNVKQRIDAYYKTDYTSLVDPFIGTGGHGHTFPGATVPFGMVQISPDTRWENWDGSSGYHYSDNTIMGFSQTHLSGTGAPEYCDVLFMPTVGDVQILPGDENNSKTGYRSAFSHDNEHAYPGYYSVFLDDDNVKAELTATTRSGLHRYTFPASGSANIIIDLKNRDHVLESNIEIIGDTVIQGLRRSKRWADDQYVYFYAKFSKPFSSYGIALDDKLVDGIKKAEGKNIRAFVQFQTKEQEVILVKIGISAVDIEGAKKNLEAENPGWDFESVVEDAKEKWNSFLSKIEVEGGTEKQRRIFYTGLYHTAIAPNEYMDVDRRYRGVDHKIHKADGFTNYTVFSLWDTFRANMPLYTIIDPNRYADFIKTFLEMYRISGVLPQWELAGNNTAVMIGYHTHSVILDGYVKGIRGFDSDLAYEAMKKRVQNIGYYKDLGFIPADKVGGSVSMVMEYSYNDWSVARMAKLLNKEEDYQDYIYRAQFYKNMFDTSTGFMRPKNSDRKWVTPFDPSEGSEHFVEGNSYQYSLFAPHDVIGLIDLIGGDQNFIAWMDTLFTKQSKHDENAIDATGLIGQYAHGNEPSHHMAYLYNYAGVPWKTQAMVRQILDTMYDDQPNGLSGNEDCGQMSAWYILSAMGFYQVCPGTPNYVIGSPIFDKVTINLENGKKFTIRSNNVSAKNKYIQSVTFNGAPYSKSWFTHDNILNGAELVFEMGASPNKNYGAAKEDCPVTEKFEPAVTLPYAVTTDEYFLHTGKVTLKCDDPKANIYYTTDGNRPTEKSLPYTKPVTLDQTTDLRFAAFRDGLIPSLPVSIKLNKMEFEDYQNFEVKGRFVKGLNYKYYHAQVMEEDELDQLTPLETGIISGFTIENRKRENYFGYIYSGYLDIPKDGIYTFSIKVNDKCTLYLDGKEFLRGGFRTVALRKGKYKIDQKYFQLGAKKFNIVSWEGPGMYKQEIPASALFHLEEQLIDYVNPFIGTDEDGHTFPGALVPFGMVQLSPDNGDHGYNWCSGYHYSSKNIAGFSHTHFSGTGAEDLCDISMFPLVNLEASPNSIRSEFSHEDEIARPGYYSVLLKTFNIKAELTATMHCGLHRYTFPESKKSAIKLDLGFGNGIEARVGHNGNLPLECYFKKINNNTVVGFRRSIGFAGERCVYFAAQTSKPFDDIVIFADSTMVNSKQEGRAVRVSSYLTFPATKNGEQVMVKVAISSANIEGAMEGLQEIKDWNFETVKKNAEDAWEVELSKIKVTSRNPAFKETFYTSVYHCYFAPFRFDDALGKYTGADKKIYEGKNIHTLSSLWDTYRATAPLFTLTQTERLPAIINSYLEFYKQYGLLPSWELFFNEANVMPGYHAVPIIADAILKDIEGFDYNFALEAMKETANQDIRESDVYLKYGYVPDDLDPRQRGVTKTVEYAFDDWCIAQVAKKMNKPSDYVEFMKRSGYWKNVFDSTTGFVRPKNSKGNWMLPFNPKESIGFQEGNAWIYTWYVPQDLYGLIHGMGGADLFAQKLDSLYNAPDVPYRDIKNHGFYGLSEFSNEPSHHVPYLYSYLGKPWQTADKVNHILTKFFNNKPNGLCGNDDCGQLSAWYVLSSIGFYPVNPANGEYVFGSPLANKSEFKLSNGRYFVVKAENLSKQNIYIQKAKLNGIPYTRSFIKHSDIMKGGELVFYMGNKPSETWGTKAEDMPGK